MAKHHPDLIMCRKQPGVGKKCIFGYFVKLFVYFTTFLVFRCDLFSFITAIGRLCEKRELQLLTDFMFGKLVYKADCSKKKLSQYKWLVYLDR